MKGIQGLIIAAVLGLFGAAANFYYLNTEAQKKDMVAFIGIESKVPLGRGDKLTEGNMVKVEIPKNHVGNLRDYACLWEEYEYLKGKSVWRTLESKDTEGGVLLLKDDYKKPPPALELEKGDRAVAIPARAFPTALLNPGDKVSFRFTTLAAPSPTPASKPAADAAAGGTATSGTAVVPPKQPEEPEPAPPTAAPHDTVGPFVVVSIGNRLGNPEVMKAAKIAAVQENTLLIRVSKTERGEEEQYEKLMTDIQRYGANYVIELIGK